MYYGFNKIWTYQKESEIYLISLVMTSLSYKYYHFFFFLSFIAQWWMAHLIWLFDCFAPEVLRSAILLSFQVLITKRLIVHVDCPTLGSILLFHAQLKLSMRNSYPSSCEWMIASNLVLFGSRLKVYPRLCFFLFPPRSYLRMCSESDRRFGEGFIRESKSCSER